MVTNGTPHGGRYMRFTAPAFTFGRTVAFLTAFCTLSLIGVAAAQSPPQSSPVTFFMRGDFAGAETAFREAARLSPEAVYPRIGLVRSQLRQDHWQEARTEAHNAVEKFPLSGDLRGLYAMSLLRAGRLDEAREQAKLARQAEPFSFFAHLATGQIALWDDNTQQARAAFSRALEVRPDDPDAWLGRVDASDSDTKDADDHYAIRKYLNLKPTGYPHTLRVPQLTTVVANWSQKHQAFENGEIFSTLAPVSEAELRKRERSGGDFETRIPFEYRLGFVVLTVRIDNAPFKLIFDTGGARSILLVGDAVKRLNAQRLGGGILRGASGSEAATQFKAARLTVGDLTLGPVPVDGVGPKPGLGDGIIGGAVFEDWCVTVDFPKKELVLRRGTKARAPEADDGNYAVSQEFRYRGGKIFLPLRVGEEPIWGILDTGSSLDMLSVRQAERSAEGIEGDKITRGQKALTAGIGDSAPEVRYVILQKRMTLRYGQNGDNGSFFQPVTVGLSVLDEQVSPVIGTEISFLMGMPTLRLYQRVTFDYPRRVVTFEAKHPEGTTTAMPKALTSLFALN